MAKEDLISGFRDTFARSKDATLYESTQKAVDSNKGYEEGFVAIRRKVEKFSKIIVEENTTLNVANKYRSMGKIAVLNFANPHNPGGGVVNGALDQEECLCRSSNLYACLIAYNVKEKYYEYHKATSNLYFTDRLIYTKDVPVFKNDDLISKLIKQEDWFNVDVITCAAPYNRNPGLINPHELKNI